MKSITPGSTRSLELLRLVALLFALGGCGGGVDSGGTGATNTYSSGPITGFGSIIVNGVRFDDSSATVTDDDGFPRALGLGMTVEVRGSAITIDATGSRSSASSISISSEIVGRIRSTSGNALDVLGQSVEVRPGTVFAGSFPGVGDFVEVYALYNAADNVYVATRIEHKTSPPSEYRIRGKVLELNAIPGTFKLGTELISYSALAPGDVPAGLADGAIVRVRVKATPLAGGVWQATRLRDGASRPDEGAHIEVEGLIENFFPGQFKVGGVAIATNASTDVVVPPGVTLGNGIRVEVEGSYSGGVLVAARVVFEDDSGPPEFTLEGSIEDVDGNAKTIRVRGQTISYTPTTEYRTNPPRSEADLRIGAIVKVKATLINGIQLQATRIEFSN